MATIAELLQAANRKIAHLEQIKTAMKSAINGSGSTVGDKFADYPPAVTNGRAGIAAAITEKGVQTAADAPFDVLEANVRAIQGKPILNGYSCEGFTYAIALYCTSDGEIKINVDLTTLQNVAWVIIEERESTNDITINGTPAKLYQGTKFLSQINAFFLELTENITIGQQMPPP